MDMGIVGRAVDGHRANGIAVEPDVIAGNESVGTGQREALEVGFHVERCCRRGIIERALQVDGILAVKNQVGIHACYRRCRVKVKVGIQLHIALFLAVIDKILDINHTVTIGVGAVPVEIDNSVDGAAGLVEHRHDARPFLELQIIDIELDVLGIVTWQSVCRQFDAAAVAVEHQVGVNHA